MPTRRIVSDSAPGTRQSTPSITQHRRRWSDQGYVDWVSDREEDTDISSGEEGIHTSNSLPEEPYPNSSEVSDFNTYPYPLNVHRVSSYNDATEASETQFDTQNQSTVAQTWPWYHYGLRHNVLEYRDTYQVGSYSISNATNNGPLYYPEPCVGSLEEASSGIEKEDSAVVNGPSEGTPSDAQVVDSNDLLFPELIDKYQLVEFFKQVVSLLPPVYDKPDAPALSPIPSTKRVIIAIKGHHMLPDKFSVPLRGPSDRRGEKVFVHPAHVPIQWLGYGRQHALVIGVRSQQHPAMDLQLEGTFENLYNETREMFYVQKNNLYYAGTFKCLRIEDMIASQEIVESLDMSLISQPFQAGIIKAALLAQASSLPHESKQRADLRIMTKLCSNGTIKFEWVAFQCVGFDEDLYQALGGTHIGPSVPTVRYVQKLLHDSVDQNVPQVSGNSDASVETSDV
ncbi:hypothetical protein EV360DRAFT_84845 [Lentinula raphanica]|nr:hypothetical protein EV360DRAFT_84845 [Lentinula raphanica]